MLDAVQSITRAISGDVERLAKRSRRDALLLGLMVLFGMTAYVAGVAAAAVYVSSLYGPVWALLLVSLAAIFAMLVVIVVQHAAKERDRRDAAISEARMRMVSTLGAALLPPLVVKSKAGSTAAIVGGLAFVANELLKPASPTQTRPQPPRRQLPPTHVNGAVNPFIQDQEQEYAR